MFQLFSVEFEFGIHIWRSRQLLGVTEIVTVLPLQPENCPLLAQITLGWIFTTRICSILHFNNKVQVCTCRGDTKSVLCSSPKGESQECHWKGKGMVWYGMGWLLDECKFEPKKCKLHRQDDKAKRKLSLVNVHLRGTEDNSHICIALAAGKHC